MNLLIFSFFLSTGSHAITLDESFREALNKNETVGQSSNKVTQSEERLKQLRGAVLPNVGLNATYFIQPELSAPIAREIFPNKQTTVKLTVTQPIFRGLREFSALSMQKNVVAAERETHQSSLIALYQNIAQSYFNVLLYEQDLKNLNQQAGIYSKRVGELQARVKRGESSASEALTAQSAEVTLLSDIQTTTSLLASERENFAYLTGLAAESSITDPNLLYPNDRKIKLAPVDSFLEGVAQRPDILAAKKRYEASDDQVSIAKGAHFPSIDVVGNYYLTRPPGFLNEINWDLQLNLTLPIFEGFATQAKVRESASQRMDAELEFHRLQRQAEQEVRSLYKGLQSKLEQLDVLKRSVEIADRNSETLQREYRRGLSRNIDVQIALADYRIAKRAMDQAHFSSQYEWIKLQTAASKINFAQFTPAQD